MIIFLGAGASRPFGIPTMREFVEIFDEEMGQNRLYNEIKSSFDREYFDLEILMTILEDLSKGRKELFRTISPQTSAFLFSKIREKGLRHADTLTRKASNAKRCLSELKGVIRRECFEAVQNNANMILEVYDQLFKYLHAARGFEIAKTRYGGFHRAGDGKFDFPSDLKIFTTNYDTCIETFLNRHQVNFTQGIVSRYGYHVLDVDSYDDRDTKVGVFKLHGSVDLFKKNGEIRQLPAFPSKDGLTYLGDEFGEEHIRFPIEFGGYRHVIESPYLDMFRLFRDRIKVEHQSLWLLIGSSFRDITICSIMNDVLRLEELGRHPLIILINPNAKAIVKRLKKWGMNTFAGLITGVEEKFGTPEYIKGLEGIFNPKSQS